LVEGYSFRLLVLLCPSNIVGMVASVMNVTVVVEVGLLISAAELGDPVLVSRVEHPAATVAYFKQVFLYHNNLQRTLFVVYYTHLPTHVGATSGVGVPLIEWRGRGVR